MDNELFWETFKKEVEFKTCYFQNNQILWFPFDRRYTREKKKKKILHQMMI